MSDARAHDITRARFFSILSLSRRHRSSSSSVVARRVVERRDHVLGGASRRRVRWERVRRRRRLARSSSPSVDDDGDRERDGVDVDVDVAPRVAVACASRSGAPPTWARRSDGWNRSSGWRAPRRRGGVRATTRDADAVVTTIGALPMPWMGGEEIVRLNGDTNVVPGRAAMMNGNAIGGRGGGDSPLVQDWRRTLTLAETFARDEFACVDEGRSAVVLRPAAVSGTRRVGGGVSLPLSLVMDPARVVLDGRGLAHAPVPLENVARAAARAAGL